MGQGKKAYEAMTSAIGENARQRGQAVEKAYKRGE